MHVLFEEDGAFKTATLVADNDSSLQVETASGKRSKIKTTNVLLRYSEPAPALLGVIIMPQVTVALLRPEQAGAKAVRLRVGEMVGEWRLEAVLPNRVVLSKGPTKQELALARSKPPAVKRIGAKPPNPATPPKAPRAQRPDPQPSIAPPNPP